MNVRNYKAFQRVEVKSREALRQWLAQHHQQRKGIWLVTDKKGTANTHVPYEAIVEECLCFGWIDSQPRALDDKRAMLYLAPRKKGSGWSALNKKRVEALIAQGLMHEAGLQKIEAARQDGSWDFLNDVDALAIPADLEKALRRMPPAWDYFEGFPRSAKRGILEWVKRARRLETRQRRIEETTLLAAQNKRALRDKLK